MVIKVYVSGISASPEIRSYQQRAQFILDSLRINYESIDITDPGHEEIKDMIKEKCKHRNDQLPKTPQFFNESIYCGDWFDFEIASDEDRVLDWLGLEDTREEEFEKLSMEAKIEGNNFINNIDQVENTTIDNTITTETITMEESIIIGKQRFKTAPFYLTPENENQLAQTKEFVREVEEEICMLEDGDYEVIKTEEEIISSTTKKISSVESNENDENEKNEENEDDENEENNNEENNNEENNNEENDNEENDNEKNENHNNHEKNNDDDNESKVFENNKTEVNENESFADENFKEDNYSEEENEK